MHAACTHVLRVRLSVHMHAVLLLVPQFQQLYSMDVTLRMIVYSVRNRSVQVRIYNNNIGFRNNTGTLLVLFPRRARKENSLFPCAHTCVFEACRQSGDIMHSLLQQAWSAFAHWWKTRMAEPRLDIRLARRALGNDKPNFRLAQRDSLIEH